MSPDVNQNEIQVMFEYGTTAFKRRWKLYDAIRHDMMGVYPGNGNTLTHRPTVRTVDDYLQVTTSMEWRDLRSFLIRLDSFMRLLYTTTVQQVVEGLGNAPFDLEFRVLITTKQSERAFLWYVLLAGTGILDDRPAIPKVKYLLIDRHRDIADAKWHQDLSTGELIDVAYDHMANFPLIAT